MVGIHEAESLGLKKIPDLTASQIVSNAYNQRSMHFIVTVYLVLVLFVILYAIKCINIVS